MILLTPQEAKVLDEFIAEYYANFQKVAYKYLTNDETEALCGKLEKA